jgi:hypothetical protein
MRPEHTKPFDLEAAKAGAPYCCRDGQAATILKWDGRSADYPLIGVYTEHDDTNSWTMAGGEFNSGSASDCDLVMIPLGMCEGKPVWWGDKLLDGRGDEFTAPADNPGLDWSVCTWPKPAPQYPQTRMTNMELSSIFADSGFSTRVADAVIARAIEDGDVVPTTMLEKVAVTVRNRCALGCVDYENGFDLERGIGRIDLDAIIKAVREGKA